MVTTRNPFFAAVLSLVPLVPLVPLVALLTLSTTACSTSSDETIPSARADAGGQSFRGDVIPIMRRWCSNSSCHANKATTLGVYFPIDEPSELYQQLQRESPQARGAKFVVAADPAKSYFYAKIEGTHGNGSFACAPSCGDSMPPGTKMDDNDRETIKRWIVAGAKDD